ncbi:hypothetical protein SERLADRAFT_442800 [Serpula lacrymans var. lacrymans S7.9]|uniref:Uncharacterized protein n=1 Tax=Serpula lacrymans var. lacrymans (strain S7.9) TaxID=578457 RepID=F8P9Z4_SERL9|nr:uncharacterized protein SERLADRAFT_442800 [Serpula lacrymans var. lacrymans S7.9]EGO19992.1 hypothetical protein SERLADRAFT_442800 [Serpula lacrymans var. lacrymans S7.9]
MVDASHRECPPRLVLAPDDRRNLYPRPLPPHRGRGGPSSTWMQMLGPARGLDASRKPQRKRAANATVMVTPKKRAGRERNAREDAALNYLERKKKKHLKMVVK